MIKKYLYELKNKCHIEIYDDISTVDLLSISDVAICGWSSIAYEALFFDVQPIRILNSTRPPHFDLNDSLPIPRNPNELKKMLNKKTFLTKKATMRKLIKSYFYKLDNKSHQRFWNFVNKISNKIIKYETPKI